ncbi:MAG: methionyl-tRNA formyltransferase [Capsulimonadales bacterium]|nr:methionyl-tRNA formyltransferase [Capsulimonadales bacterium]
MRVLFFGTSSFAVPTLQALHDAAPRHAILGVVTQPDRPSGRGMKLQMSPVKERALELGYEIHQPERVRRKPFPAVVQALAPDALVVVSFGQIIPQSLLDLPPFGGINVHASLLPRWRGAAPIHRAIMAGDTETGVATMRMEATLDTGPVFLVARETIRDDDTTGTLEPRLAALGGPLLVETLDRLEAGTILSTPQPDEGMVYAATVERADGLLDPLSEEALTLARRVRGVNPRPGAFLLLDGKPVKVWETATEPLSPATPAGTVAAVRKDGILVATKAGGLLLTRVQPENKAAMSAADYARGARLAVGAPATRPA